jgi:hypothetical protein
MPLSPTLSLHVKVPESLNPEPVIMIFVPPEEGPDRGKIFSTCVTDTNSNEAPSTDEKSAPLFDTPIVTLPEACAGVVQTIAVGETNLALTIMASKAHDTAVVFSKPVPESVMRVPPWREP